MFTGYETMKIKLSKHNKFNFVVSLFYHTPLKSNSPDYNPTTDIKKRFGTHGHFANQVIIFDLHAIEARNSINVISLCP